MNPDPNDVNPGILAYFHWLNKWPPLFACMADMSYVDGLVLEHMIHTHGEYLTRLEMGDTAAARDTATRCVEGLQKLLGVPTETEKTNATECIA